MELGVLFLELKEVGSRITKVGCSRMQGQFVSLVRVYSFSLLRDIPEESN